MIKVCFYFFIDLMVKGDRCNMGASNGRLVISYDNKLNARRSLGGVLLLDTVFQSPTDNTHSLVKIEIPSQEVSLNE